MTTAPLFLLTEAVSQGARPYYDGAAVFMTSGWGGDHPGWDDVVTAGFLACEEEGYIQGVQLNDGLTRDTIAYQLTFLGRALLADTSREELLSSLGVAPSGSLPSSGDRALWLWLLRHGGTLGFMESTPDPDNGNMLHLRACGLDWDRTQPVRDDAWTTVDGTFADEERHHGVQGQAVCACGLVGGSDPDSVRYSDRHTLRPSGGGPLEVYAEVSGLLDLLRGIL